jgi:hypothetical protein
MVDQSRDIWAILMSELSDTGENLRDTLQELDVHLAFANRDYPRLRSWMTKVINGVDDLLIVAHHARWLAYQNDVGVSRFALLSTSLPDALAGLLDLDPLVRRCSLVLLAEEYHHSSQMETTLRSLISIDPDNEIRAFAIGYLSELYEKSNDMTVCSIFAKILLSAAEPIDIRRSAYKAILTLRGELSSLKKPIPFVRIPEDIAVLSWKDLATIQY